MRRESHQGGCLLVAVTGVAGQEEWQQGTDTGDEQQPAQQHRSGTGANRPRPGRRATRRTSVPGSAGRSAARGSTSGARTCQTGIAADVGEHERHAERPGGRPHRGPPAGDAGRPLALGGEPHREAAGRRTTATTRTPIVAMAREVVGTCARREEAPAADHPGVGDRPVASVGVPDDGGDHEGGRARGGRSEDEAGATRRGSRPRRRRGPTRAPVPRPVAMVEINRGRHGCCSCPCAVSTQGWTPHVIGP